MAVDYEKEGRIAIITINRPEAMNALNADVREEMQAAFIDFKDNPDLWVAILTGAGDRAFSAGADIKDFRPATSEEVEGRQEAAPIRADMIWKPFIAAIHGYCLGGGLELAMTCDIRIAAEDAQLGQPEVNIGFMPGTGATQRLPRFVPAGSGSRDTADWQPNKRSGGLAHRPGKQGRAAGPSYVHRQGDSRRHLHPGTLGVRAAKEAMVRGYDMTLEEGLKLERKLVTYLRTTEDFMEGARAFAQKRPPQYKAK